MKPFISSFLSAFCSAVFFASAVYWRNEYAAMLRPSRAVPGRANGSIARSGRTAAKLAAAAESWRKGRREGGGMGGGGSISDLEKSALNLTPALTLTRLVGAAD